MAGIVIHPAVIISMQCLSQKHKLRLYLIGILSKFFQIKRTQTVGYVQTKPVYVIKIYPFFYHIKLMLPHLWIIKIQLYQFQMSFPAFIPESIVVMSIPVKIQMKPVTIGTFPFFLPDILKCPEASAHMVKHTVKHHLQTCLMNGTTDCRQILLRSQTPINLPVISGIISMIITVHQRIKKDAGRSCLFDM